MSSLPRPSSPVHPETARAFLARLEREEHDEHARIVREYPTGAARLFRDARRVVTIARSLETGQSSEREYRRALDDLAFACDEMDADPTADANGDPIGDRDDRTEPPMPGGLIDVELDGLLEDPPAMGGAWNYPGGLPVIAGGSPEAYEPSQADREEYSGWSSALDDDADGMAFPAKPDSLEDRRRFDRQNRQSEASFARDVD